MDNLAKLENQCYSFTAVLQNKKPLKASFAGCSQKDRKTFPQSSCILPISIMQKKEHEGERFEATIRLVNKSFEFCSLLIVDSLYRYTLKIDYFCQTETALLNLANQAGEDWLDRNATAYKQLTIPYRIIRWNECLSRPDFLESQQKIDELYNTNDYFKKSIDFTAEEYLSRQINNFSKPEQEILKGAQSEEDINRRLKNINYEHAFSCCVNYLKEECAAMCLYSKPPFKNHEFEVYPTGRTKALAAIYEILIKPHYPELLKPVAIRFKR